MATDERIGVIGLGYVGLPLAMAFARAYPSVTAFDTSPRRIAELRAGHDATQEVDSALLRGTTVNFTGDAEDLRDSTIFVVTVPTPVDADRRPDLAHLRRACETIGAVLRPGAVVVIESTVYPGVTEEVCGPILAVTSGLRRGVGFKLGYSPERVNPGDRRHTIDRVVKVVAGEDDATTERLAALYGRCIPAGVHRAPSIRVAEAAKVIENTQRDLNIALMNELAIIFDRLDIRTKDVLDAAGTKWNFLPFTPGLVGGHCIGVDPHYLTAKAQAVGYHPEVILAGRRINDGMAAFVAQKLVKLLIRADLPVRGARVGILGLTFKENVPDLRNSRVPDIVTELRQFGIETSVHDPLADPAQAVREYGIEIAAMEAMEAMDAVVLAVPHAAYSRAIHQEALLHRILRADGVLVDVKSAVEAGSRPPRASYWSL